MARKPAVELAKEWLDRAEEGDSEGMAELLSEDALFYADLLRGRRFHGREEIERFLSDSELEASGFSFTEVDEEYAVVTVSVRRHINGNGGLADSTLAMVFKADGDEIVCLDTFMTEREALRSVLGS
jgi:ketosteroid isomerase-like protein